MPYGIVVLLVAVVGIIGVVLMQRKVARMAAWLSLGLVILFYFLLTFKNSLLFHFHTLPIPSKNSWSGK